MPKIRVLIFPFHLLSHYLRCLEFAKKFLPNDKYEVHFLHSEIYEKHILQNNYQTFSCEQFDADFALRCSTKFNFSWLNITDIEKVFLSQIQIINKLKPDIVIGDVAPTLKMAAEFTNVEYTALVNGYMTKYYALTRKLSRTHFAYRLSKIVPSKYFDKITRIAEKISFKIVHLPFKKIRKKYALKGVSNYLSEMEGDQNFICDDALLFPQRSLPDNYFNIEPLIYKSTISESSWLDEIGVSKPIIFVSMGSSGNWSELKFLNDECYSRYTIITAGDSSNILNASHIISKSFVNLEDVLERADLMICHGGNGTIYLGLTKGVYMLCYTNHFEQEWNVQALENKGYGRSLNDVKIIDREEVISASLKIKLQPYVFGNKD